LEDGTRVRLKPQQSSLQNSADMANSKNELPVNFD